MLLVGMKQARVTRKSARDDERNHKEELVTFERIALSSFREEARKLSRRYYLTSSITVTIVNNIGQRSPSSSRSPTNSLTFSSLSRHIVIDIVIIIVIVVAILVKRHRRLPSRCVHPCVTRREINGYLRAISVRMYVKFKCQKHRDDRDEKGYCTYRGSSRIGYVYGVCRAATRRTELLSQCMHFLYRVATLNTRPQRLTLNIV